VYECGAVGFFYIGYVGVLVWKGGGGGGGGVWRSDLGRRELVNDLRLTGFRWSKME
jgi:hypothetical protein